MQLSPAKTFQDLIVWQKAHALVLGIYRASSGFPKSETYGLVSQIRRAAISIPANIAEGFKKRGRSDKARFMNIAQASSEEVRYYLILAKDLDYLRDDDLMAHSNKSAACLMRTRERSWLRSETPDVRLLTPDSCLLNSIFGLLPPCPLPASPSWLVIPKSVR